jgi:hypothetical protein
MIRMRGGYGIGGGILTDGAARATGRAPTESVIDHYHREHDVVFVGAAGNEGSCVEQYPAALESVIGVAALGPTGPAEWSNDGSWVDACAPGTDLVSLAPRPSPLHGHHRQRLTGARIARRRRQRTAVCVTMSVHPGAHDTGDWACHEV